MALALPFFAVTLFVSAFLLFLVQPMIGKMILPKLGGTPQVWNTCMLFFQVALLLGYGYTHAVSSRLPLRRQLIVHSVVLFLPLIFLFPPIGPFNVAGWTPPAGSNPIWATLLMLTLVVGIPFFVVATSAPLLQRWFAHTGHPSGSDPYFLYAASNLGSLLSLIAYPFVVEPWVDLRPTQAWTWAVGYLILVGLIIYCVTLVYKSAGVGQFTPGPDEPMPEPPVPPAEVLAQTPPPKETGVKAGPAPSAPQKTGITRKKGLKVPGKPSAVTPEPTIDLTQPRTEEVTGWRRLRWVLLAFAPSSLMLGVTSYVSMDLSPFPLLWVIPLALYLVSFILVFSKWPVPWIGTPHRVVLFIQPIFILGLCIIYLSRFDPFYPTLLSFFGFFLTALVCHGELARDRPTPKHLTEFFLWMSVGGALGGLFNGMFAPLLFVGVVEYPIAIIASCMLRPRQRDDGWFDELLLSAFPSFQNWVRETGAKLAQSFKRPATDSNWVLNYSLDVFFALFILGLSLFIRTNAVGSWGWYEDDATKNGLIRILRFIGFSERGAWEFHDKAFNIGVYGIPLVFCFFFAVRPLRFGLSVAAFLFANLVLMGRDTRNIYADRSYFGVLRVRYAPERVNDPEIDFSFFEKYKKADPERAQLKYANFANLLHGTTDHGHNYHIPTELRRLATTYYHRKGPVGTIMERYNWGSIVKGKNVAKQNTFYADARMPSSIVGLAAVPFGVTNLPVELLTCAWSEPPYATIGLGTGTMASYGRPFQHVTFYEIDEKIRSFSLPPSAKYTMAGQFLDEKGNYKDRRDPFFVYLVDAIARGVNLEVIMGDARFSMEKEDPSVSNLYSRPDPEGEELYVKHAIENPTFSKREKYYKVIEVDAFSSDAIPVHLITLEAIRLYYDKIADDGVIMVHTSNRHLDLVWPVTSIVEEMRKTHKTYTWMVGKDPNPNLKIRRSNYLGHTGSEYVMLATDEKYLQTDIDMPGAVIRWQKERYPEPLIWTDNYSNIVRIMR